MYPDELQRLPLKLEKMFYELQDRIMSDVVRRLRKTGEITSTADYQLVKMQILGNSTEFIESEIKRLTGMTDPEIWEVYDRVANKDYARMKSTYEQINGNFVPYEENDILQQWTEAAVRQTKWTLENITGSLGFTVGMGGGKIAFTPFSQYYQQYLDRACLDVVTGSFDYNTVLRRVVKEMTASGLQMVDYASGYHSRAPVAARRALMTGVHQLTAKMNEKIAKDLHTDYYEVTAHAGARPTHAVWQGRVYHYRDLGIVCGLGDVTGLCGANCRHSYYAFIPGVSVRTYTDEYLEDLRRKDAEIRTYHGKHYNGYEATQRQRQMETTMRAQRANIKQLKEGRADADTIRAAQTRYLTTLHEYQGFSKAMNLPEQMERVYMDGLGRMSGGRIPRKTASALGGIAKSGKFDIMTSGARIVDTYSKKAIDFAEMYYKEIRKFSTDAKRIALNLGKKEAEIKKVKAYLFEDNSLYDPDLREWRRFDPDCAIAQSWQRLMSGKNIQPHDRTLIEHELYEMKIKQENPEIDHQTAHELATKKYNYRKEVEEYYGNLKKRQKNKG